ncbi:hypothetical protein nbrc107696_15430 [Gordonia spumicola]|uniref:DUF2771 domain-containing protein n=1 Tax=Gordonia spumicola TaxID=589161 RepID=A0A7I9V719_9ACTN|nr:DUF2771 family protein [Gordonia spumicola]GEE01097.1 hypothetical protein nbrc107696_15430 [Gordonia spumicola]
MLQPGDKKALAILAAAVTTALVLIAGLTAVMVSDSEDQLPTVSVQTTETLVRAQPNYWCEPDMTGCSPVDPRTAKSVPLQIARATTPIDTTLMLTVPKDVAVGPWFLYAQYATPTGVQRVVTFNRSDDVFTTTLTSTRDRVLLGIDVQSVATVFEDSPNGIESPDGSIFMRATFTIDTRPDGYVVRNTTELPDVRG